MDKSGLAGGMSLENCPRSGLCLEILTTLLPDAEYHCRKFKPRETVMKALSPGMFHKALTEAENMFE